MDARVRLEAAKLLLTYGLGTPPKMEAPEDDDAVYRAMPEAQLEAIVRRHYIEKPHADAEFDDPEPNDGER